MTGPTVTNTQPQEQKARGRYQRWPEAVKRQIVAESYAPGNSVAVVARQNNVNANQLFQWRQKFGNERAAHTALPPFVPVALIEKPPKPKPKSTVPSSLVKIAIELPNGFCIRTTTDVDETGLSRIVTALGRL